MSRSPSRTRGHRIDPERHDPEVLTHRAKWGPSVIYLVNLIKPGNREWRHLFAPPNQRGFGLSLPTFNVAHPPAASWRDGSLPHMLTQLAQHATLRRMEARRISETAISQLRRGVLEFCVLALLRDGERYSYELRPLAR